jgi:oligosaccharide repeat unit polymerase
MRSIFFVIVAALNFFLILFSLFVSNENGIHQLSFFYLFLMVLMAVYVVVDKSSGGMSFIFVLFFLFFIAFPAYIQISNNVYPWRDVGYSSDILASGYFYLLVFNVFFVIAHYFFNKKVVGLRFGSKHDEGYLQSIVCFVVIFSVLSFPLTKSALFIPRIDVFDTAGEGLVIQLIMIGRSVTLLALVSSLILLKDFFSYKNSLIFSASFICFLVYNYIPALPRFQFLGSVLAVFLLFINFYSAKVKILGFVFSFVFLIYLFPSIKVIGKGGGVDEVIEALLSIDIIDYVLRVDFDGFMQIVDTVIYLDGDGVYRYGMNFLGVILFFIPRSIWPSKPLDSGGIVSEFNGYFYNNVSSPIVAESLISFGLLGVCFVACFFGFFVSKIENSVLKGAGRHYLILYCLLAGFMTIILRGALNGVAPQFASAFLLMLLVHYFRRLRV